MPKLITLGETMTMLVPENDGPLRYVPNFRIRMAGAESNVAIGVCKLGEEAAWIGRLGDDEFGRYLLNQMRSEGVDCSHAIFDEKHRTGVMFKEIGEGETKVFYYRENSAASHMCPGDLSRRMFDGASILHLTGITPVLSESCRDTVLEAIELAKSCGLSISFDPNIRRKLWGEKDFRGLIRDITLKSNIVLMGLSEAKTLFDLDDPQKIFKKLFSLGTAKYIAIKNGDKGAVVSDGGQSVSIAPYPCRCVDPVGAGDGFNAGFLTGLMRGEDIVTAGRMGAICGALATQTTGDMEGYPDAKQMSQALNHSEIIYR